MAQACQHFTALSQLFKDPDVRAAFWRAERDNPMPPLPVEAAQPKPVLIGGVAAELELA